MEPDGEVRRCHRCGELKAVEEFSWRRKARGQRDSFCRPCRSAYGKERYAANRQRYIDEARIEKQRLSLERTRYLIEYFVTHPCLDCGERTRLSSSSTKCEVVCANCHRRRKARRRGALRTILTQVRASGEAG